MAIEGPLRELGIHDVFQLLDLSRKTGTLTVRSSLRDNEGTIFFGSGRVIYASIRSNPHYLGELLLRVGKVSEGDLERAITMQREKHATKRLGELLVEIGAISQRELSRQMRLQVEEVVFELLSWTEGFFSFEEGAVEEHLPDAAVSISTESLLMEGARRIDEWSRIATRIPDLGLVAKLSDIPEERAPLLDLLPGEWEVLSMVDNTRTVREMAHALGRSDFDVAKVLYGLVCTGVVEVDANSVAKHDSSVDGDGAHTSDIIMHASEPRQRGKRGKTRSHQNNGKSVSSVQDLLNQISENSDSAQLWLELGFAQMRDGLLADAIESWKKYVELDPRGKSAQMARDMLIHAGQLQSAMEEHYHGG